MNDVIRRHTTQQKSLLIAILLMVCSILVTVAQDVAVVDEAVSARLVELGANLPKGYGVTKLDDFNVLLAEKEVVLLDVREVDEYAAGHLDGAFNVPLRTVAQNLNLLPDKNATIVVICKSGGRAMLAATALQVLGYTDVKVLAGGFDAWLGEELPVVLEPFVAEAGTAPDFDAAVLAAVDGYLSQIPEGYGMVGAAKLAEELVDNPPILIDVRSDEEWDSGYIEGAQQLWINEFMARQAEWPADKAANIVVYCQSGYRGNMAAVFLRLMGYTNVRNLSGGVAGWTKAELPLVGVPEQAIASAFDLKPYLADYVANLPETFNAVKVADVAVELKAGGDLLLVDVRTADEFAENHLEGAINIPLNDLAKNLQLLPDLTQPLVVYCGSGHRSAIAMTALNLLGYTDVRSMLSGITAWVAAENPVTTEVVASVVGQAPDINPFLVSSIDGLLSSIPAGYYTVKAADLAVELIENAPTVLDVRTDGEWASGWIEGAGHIGLAEFFTKADQWPQDLAAPIVIYDNPTHRSTMALVFMKLLGYENVRVLAGGVGAWTKAEQPLVTG